MKNWYQLYREIEVYYEKGKYTYSLSEFKLFWDLYNISSFLAYN